MLFNCSLACKVRNTYLAGNALQPEPRAESPTLGKREVEGGYLCFLHLSAERPTGINHDMTGRRALK